MGEEEILILRNRIFRRLVEAHGYRAIAIESSFPQSCVVQEFVAGRGVGSFEAVWDSGFSHGFGQLEANRELVEWMRGYNANSSNAVKIQFYGFDAPTEMSGADSPRQVLSFVLDYLGSIDQAAAREHRDRIEKLIGKDSDWENLAAMMDPTKSMGLSAGASALRLEVEDLITELGLRRPELMAGDGKARYLEAVQYASVARQLLNYHAALAGQAEHRIARLLGIRDLMMAENLAHIVERERGRGKVLAFGHNSHLKRGRAKWQLGANALEWWPAGAHLNEMLGSQYAVIGSGAGVSEAHWISRPEAGTLEARLTVMEGPARFIPTRRGGGLAISELADLPTRSGSMKNPSYFGLTPQSVTEFDGLVVLDSITSSRS